MQDLEQIKVLAESAVPGCRLELVPNGSAANQPSVWVDNDHALAVARFLRDDPSLCFDYASNVTGVDWPDVTVTETIKVKKVIDEVEQEFDVPQSKVRPGFLEAVYHLYSMRCKHGPLILRLRTENRTCQTHVPSLTPVFRGAEFQEREIYDLFGIVFDGHPDLRRLLMWEAFQDHPMRKDYQGPDDYEYEPTPHGEVMEKAKRHYSPEVKHG